MAKYTAKTADKHILYQKSVQSPEAEVDFMDRVFNTHYRRRPTRFREDFCGTALISCEFAKRRKENHAYGVDLHKPTQDWGVRHNLSRLEDEAAKRVHLVNDDVLNVTDPKVDVVGAFNFSYFIFKERGPLVDYFKTVRSSLRKEGLFILDAYGGHEAQQAMEEETKHGGFTYVWDQADYNPINDHTLCHIHFRFPDGTEIKKAFTYDWRLWTLAGIKDALADAGFKESDVFWEGTGEDGEGNGIYRRQVKAENTPGWNAYIVATP
ncbi:MAG: class I SAM-dependent methyltransferase [Planctomycetota bacterium]|nr:class I SAM-dependent methyltransferase [Planctomycetota bacterium]